MNHERDNVVLYTVIAILLILILLRVLGVI